MNAGELGIISRNLEKKLSVDIKMDLGATPKTLVHFHKYKL